MSGKTSGKGSTLTSNIVSWTFGILFVVIGVLNVFLVDPRPGAFYLVLSAIYFPLTNATLKKRFGFSIPLAVKIVLGVLVLWATLAVTDLADMAGI